MSRTLIGPLSKAFLRALVWLINNGRLGPKYLTNGDGPCGIGK
jgi:hypothetical protein